MLEIMIKTHASGSVMEIVFVGRGEWEDLFALVCWFFVCSVRRVRSAQSRTREVPLSCQW